jgi:ankyrin repeat protein
MNVYHEPLLNAVRNGDIRRVDALLMQGASVNTVDPDYERSILIWASMLGYLKIMGLLIDLGADIGSSIACATDHVDAVKLLIAHGADVNARDEKGATALINAVVGRNINVVRILLLNHANVNIREDTGESAMDWADGDDIMTKMLRDHGAVSKDTAERVRKHETSYRKEARAIAKERMHAQMAILI